MQKRWWWAAALLLLVGGLFGSGIERYIQVQHRHARAVMTLAQFHLTGLQRAVDAQDCPRLGKERTALLHVHDELEQAFPQAVAQDAEFRQRAQVLLEALRTSDAEACAAAPATLNAVELACAACHREYR
jgi:cytochrome c556